MKRETFILFFLITTKVAMGETSLVIQPLNEQEQVHALAQIGYIKVMQDSLFVYSHANLLLGKNAIKDVRHFRYGEPTPITGIDNAEIAATCRVYPNPTQDRLVIQNAHCETAYIFDMDGNLMQTNTINGEYALINVTSLPKGNYILLLGTQTVKFIKH